MDGRCTGDACPGIMNTQTTEEAMKCTVPQTVNQDLDSCKSWSIFQVIREVFVLLNPTNYPLGLTELPGGVMLH